MKFVEVDILFVAEDSEEGCSSEDFTVDSISTKDRIFLNLEMVQFFRVGKIEGTTEVYVSRQTPDGDPIIYLVYMDIEKFKNLCNC